MYDKMNFGVEMERMKRPWSVRICYSVICMAVNVTAGNRDLMLVNPDRGADDISITGLIF
jgi:hypothetical protein